VRGLEVISRRICRCVAGRIGRLDDQKGGKRKKRGRQRSGGRTNGEGDRLAGLLDSRK